MTKKSKPRDAGKQTLDFGKGQGMGRNIVGILDDDDMLYLAIDLQADGRESETGLSHTIASTGGPHTLATWDGDDLDRVLNLNLNRPKSAEDQAPIKAALKAAKDAAKDAARAARG